jgi:hypothetical protein
MRVECTHVYACVHVCVCVYINITYLKRHKQAKPPHHRYPRQPRLPRENRKRPHHRDGQKIGVGPGVSKMIDGDDVQAIFETFSDEATADEDLVLVVGRVH